MAVRCTCDGSSGCFGCRVGDGPMISSAATPTRTKSSAPPAPPQNHWEKGIVRDSRGLPLRKADGSPLGVAEMSTASVEKALRTVRDPQYHAKQSTAA